MAKPSPIEALSSLNHLIDTSFFAFACLYTGSLFDRPSTLLRLIKSTVERPSVVPESGNRRGRNSIAVPGLLFELWGPSKPTNLFGVVGSEYTRLNRHSLVDTLQVLVAVNWASASAQFKEGCEVEPPIAPASMCQLQLFGFRILCSSFLIGPITFVNRRL